MGAEVGHDVLIKFAYHGPLIVELEHAKVCEHLTFLGIEIGLTADTCILIEVFKSIGLGYTHLS